MEDQDYYMKRVSKRRNAMKRGKHTGETKDQDRENQVKGDRHTPTSDRRSALKSLISNVGDITDKMSKKSTGSKKLDTMDLEDNKDDSVVERHKKLIRRKIKAGILEKK